MKPLLRFSAQVAIISLLILMPCLPAPARPAGGGGLSSMAWAETVREDPLETRVREVSKTLRCAICQSESVWESNAELAQQMRQVIRERLAQGQSPDEIRAYFVSRYGDYILLEPRKRGLNWILWAGPFILLGIGGFFLYRTLSRWVAATSSAEPEALAPLEERERKRIERELSALKE